MAQDYEINVKVKGLGEAANQLADFTDELNKAREEGQSVSGALDYATGGAVTGFKKAAQGTKTFVKGLKLTRAAIIATGIGALVVGVTALVGAFTKTRRGARQLKTIMAGLGAVVEQLTARFQAVGGFIVDLFSKGPQAAVKQYRETIDELPDSLGEAINKAVELERATQALTDSQRALTVQRAKDRAEIKELNMVAEDTTRTLEEREAAAQKAIDIEKGLMAERERIAAEELRIAQEKAAMSDSSDEDLDRLAELEANLIDIRTESVELQTTLNNKLNTIRNEAARKAEEEAKRISDAADAKKKAEREAADAIIQAQQEVVDALDQRERASLSQMEQEVLAIEDFYNAQLDKAGDNAQLVAELEARRDAELEALFAKHADVSLQQREQLNSDLEARRMTEREKEMADLDATFMALMDAAGTNHELRLSVLDQYANEVDALNDKYRQEDLAKERAAALAKKEIQVQTATQTLSILANLNEAFSRGGTAENKKAFERNKAISVAETLVSTYMAAQKAFTSQLTATPDSPIRAALAAAAATASGLARVAAIKRTQFNTTGGTDPGDGGGGGVPGGGTQSIGVDVGTLVPRAGQPTPEPVRAYVVSNEISNKQALDRELQIQTTL